MVALSVADRTPSGRARKIAVATSGGTRRIAASELRQILGYEKLPSLLFTVDVCPFAAHLERLAWVPGVDLEPLVAMETKRRVIADVLDHDRLVVFDHDPKIVSARLAGSMGACTAVGNGADRAGYRGGTDGARRQGARTQVEGTVGEAE